jgi:hypothetical protein
VSERVVDTIVIQKVLEAFLADDVPTREERDGYGT